MVLYCCNESLNTLCRCSIDQFTASVVCRIKKTLIVHSFLNVFTFSKIDQSLDKRETSDNFVPHTIEFFFNLSLCASILYQNQIGLGGREVSPTPTARTAIFLCSSVSASIRSLIPST
jgi:hypothetical protein